MTASTPTLGSSLGSAGLLERAIGYTRISLGLVDDTLLDDPTPCAGWSLRCLLEHMDDAMAAFTEAAETGEVRLRATTPGDGEAARIVERIRERACSTLDAWKRTHGDEPVQISGVAMDSGLLAAIGALEITVHGWDVATACGVEHPIPQSLALTLLDLAGDLVGDADRGVRFAAPRAVVSGDPGARLLAFLGR